MMLRLWLIAEREVVAYAGAASFWVALLLGPVLMLFTAAISNAPPKSPRPQVVQVLAADPTLRAAVARGLASFAQDAARPVVVSSPGAAKPDSVLTVSAQGPGARLAVEGAALPDPAVENARQEVASTMREAQLRGAGVPAATLARLPAVKVSVARPERGASPRLDPSRLGRFAITMLLWLNLVGSLGMLLQAIVRERANRALEGLLSSARAHEIILGKVLGVGFLSVVILTGWLGSGAVIAATPLGRAGGGIGGLVLSGFLDVSVLLRAGLVYVLAFVMYGAALIGIGALARDAAAAQNLSRPVFGLLLLVFFVMLGRLMMPDPAASWLLWFPPFTPFVLLMSPPGSVGAFQFAGALGLIAAAALGAAVAASKALRRDGRAFNRRLRAARGRRAEDLAGG